MPTQANLALTSQGRVQAAIMCACGSLEIVAKAMCPRCLARQHRDREYFGGLRDQVLERDRGICQGCGHRPAGVDGDFAIVHHRQPGVSTKESMITLCAACHAIVHRLAVLRAWLPPMLAVLWHEQHADVPQQLQLDVVLGDFNPDLFEVDLAS